MHMAESFPVDVVLVGYENRENLGLRSILAYLLAQGYKAVLVPFYPGQDENVLAIVQRLQPRLVGFSIIFQYTVHEFGDLMRYFRANGVQAHFTAGGHFPSLCPEETLTLLPDLDSIVRFEGELTLVELIDHLDQRESWGDIRGLAFRGDSEIVITLPRPLVTDLDSLPTVYRDQLRTNAFGVKTASMLASRGCLFNCSFCSIRQFYGGAPGHLRRTRSPKAVVEEMLTLFEEGVRFFSFQDDDFAARTHSQQDWLRAFLHAMDAAGLAEQVRWKISCRVDDIQPQILEQMLSRGLMAVYLGVESGSNEGLATLNKHVSVAQNLAAIEILKRYNVALAIGFMLFDPSSTEKTLRENISFLSEVGEDGYITVNFCKMLPYAGTPIEVQLRQAGRLKGTVASPDYGFLDPKIDWYAFLVQRIFKQRNFHPDGLVARLQQADFDHRLAVALGYADRVNNYGTALQQLISRSNKLALETLETLLDEVTSREIESLLEEQATLTALAEQEWGGEAVIEIELERLQATSVSTEQPQPTPTSQM
jgi:anaerobic magnesium-protoporphyrin IX monomethyl ester cyclase